MDRQWAASLSGMDEIDVSSLGRPLTRIPSPATHPKIIPTALATALMLSAAWYCLPTLGSASVVAEESHLPVGRLVKQVSTEEYTSSFDPTKYEVAGTDFFNQRYSPDRLHKPRDQIDITYDFDFSFLKETSDRLAKVDRRSALKAIFDKLTRSAKTDTERHLAVLGFLQKAAFHSSWMQPMYEDKQAVLDPLVLLELGTMRCGGVARVGADIFEAAGYKTRLVQAVAHTTAEIFYDGSWHLFEADLNGGGQAPVDQGRIPSVEELSRNPAVLDRLPTRFEAEIAFPLERRKSLKSLPYPSYYFFSKEGYGPSLEPSWYYKTASPEQARTSRYYGWEYYETVEDSARMLSGTPTKYDPMRPKFQSVQLTDTKVKLAWQASEDEDGDLIGYRIFVSKRSRGWNYQYFIGTSEVRKYWDGGWKPEMYDALFREPPSELGLVTTTETSVELDLPPGEKRFVTVMPYDKYGESIGRRLYNMSEELTLFR